MKLYGFPGTRTNRVRWLLEELGSDYDFLQVDVQRGAHKTPEHRALHPHGLVPVLQDGDSQLIESCAMLLHLADRHPEQGLAPPVGSEERGRYYQWIVYAAATLDEPAIDTYFHTVVLPEERRKPEVLERHRPRIEVALPFLAASLGDQPFLIGDRFTAADVAVGYPLNLLDRAGQLGRWQRVRDYLERLRSRPAFQRVFAA
jgi:glutathione S-transferase